MVFQCSMQITHAIVYKTRYPMNRCAGPLIYLPIQRGNQLQQVRNPNPIEYFNILRKHVHVATCWACKRTPVRQLCAASADGSGEFYYCIQKRTTRVVRHFWRVSRVSVWPDSCGRIWNMRRTYWRTLHCITTCIKTKLITIILASLCAQRYPEPRWTNRQKSRMCSMFAPRIF